MTISAWQPCIAVWAGFIPKKKNYARAQDYFGKTLQIREALEDEFGVALAHQSIALAAINRKRYDEAIKHLNRSEATFLATKNFLYLKQYYLWLAEVYEAKDDLHNSLKYFRLYDRYKDSVYNQSTMEKFTELQTRYETEKKETESKLLKSQAEQQQLTIQQQRLFLALTVVSILALLAIIALVIRARNQRINKLKLEAQLQETLAIENLNKEKERISRDLHDNVGAQLSYLITNLEWIAQHPETVGDKKESSNRLGTLSESGRNAMLTLRETIWAISHKELSVEDFADRFKQYVLKMTEFNNNIEITFNENINDNISLPPTHALNTFRICQEAFHNALKHSNSNRIIIEFKTRDNWLCYTVSDNGSGFDPTDTPEGHYGLVNMKRRAEDIGATLSIESSRDRGTKLILKVPYNPINTADAVLPEE